LVIAKANKAVAAESSSADLCDYDRALFCKKGSGLNRSLFDDTGSDRDINQV
jgi:hypothetical protein